MRKKMIDEERFKKEFIQAMASLALARGFTLDEGCVDALRAWEDLKNIKPLTPETIKSYTKEDKNER